MRVLGGALPPGVARGSRERLSFELGAILSHQLFDPRRACAHWRGHARILPDGRYAPELARAMRELHCTGEPR